MKKNSNNSPGKIWILGPCSVESEKLYLSTARRLSSVMKGKEWYYKASFDKANRTSIKKKRGPGLEKSLKIFAKVKKEIPGIKLTTDVHEVHQVKKLIPYIDCIQIPAFLCQQTDLLVECGRHFNIVNIKKGQWVSPRKIIHAVEKVRQKNNRAEVWITERGTTFGYDKLVVDFSVVKHLKKYFDKAILDCTHSTQYPAPQYTQYVSSCGDPELAERYFLTAPLFGYDGVFAEVHPNPKKAISDGAYQLYLDRVQRLVNLSEEINRVYEED